jgi:Zyg-11 family protein
MCRLNLPDDVLFVSDRLIRILLKIFEDYTENRMRNPTNDRPENFVLRTAMHLLNILACSVHGTDKSLVGQIAIPVAMNLIRTKIKLKEADEILEVTWSFLWNITDETPENCKLFLDDCDGMQCFIECIEFKKLDLTRNMMGLFGNVAEVKELRDRLCKNELVKIFRQLLFQTNDGIEIPYNSAGVLVHVMSDGEEEWMKHAKVLNEHNRQSVIEDIETAIDKWDLKSERNINYRSFEPIFRLVNQFENPICQRWACWALANLTSVYRKGYIFFLFMILNIYFEFNYFFIN